MRDEEVAFVDESLRATSFCLGKVLGGFMSDGDKPRTVPEKDLIAIKQMFRDKEKKWESEKQSLTNQIGQLNNEIKIAKVNGEDTAEVELVKKHLLEQAEAIQEKRTKLEEDLNSYGKRDKEFRAREIASDLKSKGVEVTVDTLLSEENMDVKAKDLLVDHLAKENEALKKAPPNPGESVFESGSGGVLKKSIKDMDDNEFAKLETRLKEAALSKR